MAEFSAERDLVGSHFALFNQLLRESGESFLRDVDRQIQQLVVNGARRSDATRIVVERTVLAQGSDLDRLKDRMIAEFRKLISQASIGVFQKRLDRLADEAGREFPSNDPEDRIYVWVSVGSSATCHWRAGADKYRLNGKSLTRTSFCRERHGLRGTAEFWDRLGRPRTGQTVCLAHCECSLLPHRFVKENPGLLEGIDLSEEV